MLVRKAEERRFLRERRRQKEEDEFGDEEERSKRAKLAANLRCGSEYGLRRNRRMTDEYFKKDLRTPYIRLVLEYGVVYVGAVPSTKSDEDMLAEKDEEPLTNRDDFVGVYFPQFDSCGTHRAKAIVIFNDTPHFATMHIPSSIMKRETVNFNVVTIQLRHPNKDGSKAK